MWSPKKKRDFEITRNNAEGTVSHYVSQTAASHYDGDVAVSHCDPSQADFLAFGQYLTGLLEGDGTIIVPNPGLLQRRPVVRFCFHAKDEPLALYLKQKIGYGHLVYPKTGNYLLLEISDKAGLCHIVHLTNGHFRTPKLEAFDRLINWLQKRAGKSISSRGMDFSSLMNSAWLSGFTDADGNFHVIIAPRKKKGKKGSIRVQTHFRIELSQTYKRTSSYGSTYFDVISDVARLLDTNVYTRSRQINETVCYSYFFCCCFEEIKNHTASIFC